MKINKRPIKIISAINLNYDSLDSNEYVYVKVSLYSYLNYIRIKVIDTDENTVCKLYDRKSGLLTTNIKLSIENFFDIIYDILYDKDGITELEVIEKMLDEEIFFDMYDDNKMFVPKSVLLLEKFKNDKETQYRTTRKQAFINMNFREIVNDEDLLTEIINKYYTGIVINDIEDEFKSFRCFRDKFKDRIVCKEIK